MFKDNIKVIRRFCAKLSLRAGHWHWTGAQNNKGLPVMRIDKRVRSSFKAIRMISSFVKNDRPCDRSCATCNLGISGRNKKEVIQNLLINLKIPPKQDKTRDTEKKFNAEKHCTFLNETAKNKGFQRSGEFSYQQKLFKISQKTPRAKVFARFCGSIRSFALSNKKDCTFSVEASKKAESNNSYGFALGIDSNSKFDDKGRGGRGGRGVVKSNSFEPERHGGYRKKEKKIKCKPEIETGGKNVLPAFSENIFNELKSKLMPVRIMKYQKPMPNEWFPREDQIKWYCNRIYKRFCNGTPLYGRIVRNPKGLAITIERSIRSKNNDDIRKLWNELKKEEAMKFGGITDNVSRQKTVIHDGCRKTVRNAIFDECSKIRDIIKIVEKYASALGLAISGQSLINSVKIPKAVASLDSLKRRFILSECKLLIERMQ